MSWQGTSKRFIASAILLSAFLTMQPVLAVTSAANDDDSDNTAVDIGARLVAERHFPTISIKHAAVAFFAVDEITVPDINYYRRSNPSYKTRAFEPIPLPYDRAPPVSSWDLFTSLS